MPNEDARQKKSIPACIDAAPEGDSAKHSEKVSDPKDASHVLNERANSAKRATDYADANAGDFEAD